MVVLVCREADVRAHWGRVVGSFCDILPGGRNSYTLDDKEHGHVQLRQRNVAAETTTRYDGRRIHVVPFLDIPSSEEHRYWLSWHEAWRSPQIGPVNRRLQFRSSSLVIYTGARGANKLQVLRAEWAGSEAHIRGKVPVDVFQGNGAAHPHWHLDGVGGIEVGDDAIDSESGSVRPVLDLAELAREFGQDEAMSDNDDVLLSPNIRSLAHIDSAWSGIHLATSARWAQSEWPGPGGPHDAHAANPVTCDEIRSWLISCTRYLQSELQGQLRRGRQ